MATLEQFLRAGELGPIHFGLTVEEVAGLLGAPGDTSVRRNPLIEKYGGLQLTFFRADRAPHRRLTHVGLYFQPLAEPIPDLARPTDWLPTPATTRAEFRQFLDRIGLAPVADQSAAPDSRWVLPTGANIIFTDNELHSIQFAAPQTAKKQISISVPPDTLASLQAQARRANRSVADLCAEWVAEKASVRK
jgi:hypothetical protein